MTDECFKMIFYTLRDKETRNLRKLFALLLTKYSAKEVEEDYKFDNYEIRKVEDA